MLFWIAFFVSFAAPTAHKFASTKGARPRPMLSDLAPRAWPAPPSGVGQRLPLMCLRSPSPIAHVLTAIARAPDVVDRRFVTYAREAKSEMLGIPSDLILAAAPLAACRPGMIRPRSAANRHSAIGKCPDTTRRLTSR